MSDQEIWDILKILAALLHMGNIKYKGKVIDNLDATEIPDQSNVERVAAILGVNKQALVDALTSKTIFAHGESVVRLKLDPTLVLADDELVDLFPTGKSRMRSAWSAFRFFTLYATP